MARDKDQSNRDRKEASPGNPFKPASLKPVQLRNDPARDVSSADIRARDVPLVPFGDHASRANPVNENRYAFAPVREVRPDLKPEESRQYQLRPITVTPVQMQLLRDRRIKARELGWSIQGHRIRIGE